MTTAIVHARLIDGTGADPVPDSTVIIEDDRVARVGRAIEPPRDAEVIDAGGRTLMPGMIDAHVHLYGPTAPLQERLQNPPSLDLFITAQNARRTLDSGFTSVRDAGGAPLGLKLAIERGLIPGPRLQISVVALSQTGGHMDHTMASGVNVGDNAAGGYGPEWPHCVVDGPDEVRKAVREIIRAGADFIKLCATGGVMSPTDEPTHTQFSPEEIAVMVQEAAAAGKTCMAHAHGAAGIKNAVRAGVESIEHGSYLDDEAIAEMKRRRTFLVPTLSPPVWLLRYAERSPESLLPQTVRKTKETVEIRRHSFEEAVRAGVRIAMGTDTGIGPHGRNAEELALMVECGMTPMQAIVAATKTAAECAHLPDAGTVEPGKLADVLLVDGDPTDDIAVLADRSKLALIMKGGRTHTSTL
jgi:imidazolonepropionase-like amidohydrolase